jgi:Fe-S cluster biosynthesis and repair protein YggX
LYTTDNKAQAENYSIVRSGRKLVQPIRIEFLPYQAVMLDVRKYDDQEDLGVLPEKFMEAWLKYLENYINEESIVNLETHERTFLGTDMHKMAMQRLYFRYYDSLLIAVRKKQRIDLRNYEDRSIFSSTGNDLASRLFQKFMISIGFDGMIYREGGEEWPGKENLTAYVFYNYAVVNTWQGWQERQKEELSGR